MRLVVQNKLSKCRNHLGPLSGILQRVDSSVHGVALVHDLVIFGGLRQSVEIPVDKIQAGHEKRRRVDAGKPSVEFGV